MHDRAFYGTTAALTVVMPRPQPVQPANAIELRVERIELLFDPLDAFGERARDIAKPVEAFILDCARALGDATICIVICVPAREVSDPQATQVKGVIAAYFSRSADSVTRDLRDFFHRTRVSLLIGLCGLAACTVSASGIDQAFQSPIAHFTSEGLLILGWVSIWRPIETFLYGWWPLVRSRRLNQRIAAAAVEVRPG